MKRLQSGQGLVGYALILVLLAIVIVVIVAVFRGSPSSQDRYEAAYNRCIARETISTEHCHDIALREAYGNGSSNVYVPIPQ